MGVWLGMNKTTKSFWMSRTEYPPVAYNFQRRYLDLGAILKHVGGARSILDLGCGEGQTLLMLRELTNISNYYAYDLSKVFIDSLIKRWGDYPNLVAEVEDFTEPFEFSETDLCICMGALLYVFEDDGLGCMLSNINSKRLVCRMPCTLKTKKQEIDIFSKEYSGKYAAVYRTLPEYISILSELYNIESIDRCYPDEIESGYGTKQFLFVCKRK